MPVCRAAWNSSGPTGRILVKFHTREFFENISRKINFHYNPTRITSTLHEDLCTLVAESRCTENQNTQFMFNNSPPPSPVKLDKVPKYGKAGQATDVNIIWRMRFARWIIEAINTY